MATVNTPDKPWTADDEKFLRENYDLLTRDHLCERLGRSKKSVETKLRRMLGKVKSRSSKTVKLDSKQSVTASDTDSLQTKIKALESEVDLHKCLNEKVCEQRDLLIDMIINMAKQGHMPKLLNSLKHLLNQF